MTTQALLTENYEIHYVYIHTVKKYKLHGKYKCGSIRVTKNYLQNMRIITQMLFTEPQREAGDV